MLGGRRRSSSSSSATYVSAVPQLPAGLQWETLEAPLWLCGRTRSATKAFRSGRLRWKPRHFELSADTLRWYTHRRDGSVPELRGQLYLQEARLTTEVDSKDLKAHAAPKQAFNLCFRLTPKASSNQSSLYIHASSDEEKGRWTQALEHNIYLATNPRGGALAADGFKARSLQDLPNHAIGRSRAQSAQAATGRADERLSATDCGPETEGTDAKPGRPSAPPGL